MKDELRRLIDNAVADAEAGINERDDRELDEEECEELVDYILEYERNTPEERQSVEDFEAYIDTWWSTR